MINSRRTDELFGVQVLRGLAAVMVVLHHTLEESGAARQAFSPDWLTLSEASGVDIFFVISGLIMVYTSFKPGEAAVSSQRFLFRRITRIYPLYWVCCGLFCLISFTGFLRAHPLTIGGILGSLVLIPQRNPLIGVSWTLVYEIYFYLLFATTLVLKSMAKTFWLQTVLLAAFQVGATFSRSSGVMTAFLADPIVFEFVIGMALGVIVRRFPAAVLRGRNAVAVICLGCLLLALSSWKLPHNDTSGLTGVTRLIGWGAPAALIVFGGLGVSRPTGRLGALLLAVGAASYAVYLTHPFTMLAYAAVLKRSLLSVLPQQGVVVAVTLLALSIGWYAHVLLENPLLALIRRYTGREIIVSELPPQISA